VITASDGEECLNTLRKENPDLILLDVMMPGIDGYETCKMIKKDEKYKSTVVAMLTVKSEDEDRLRSLDECAADWHIAKPMDRKKLVEVVDWLIKSHSKRS
jgi:DNA-binding response OmpR family regulator